MSQQSEQAIKDGEVHYCPSCKKVQPIKLVFFNPHEDSEEELIICLVCGEGIGFIKHM